MSKVVVSEPGLSGVIAEAMLVMPSMEVICPAIELSSLTVSPCAVANKMTTERSSSLGH